MTYFYTQMSLSMYNLNKFKGLLMLYFQKIDGNRINNENKRMWLSSHFIEDNNLDVIVKQFAKQKF